MAATIQQRYTFRKKRSLVLKSRRDHHEGMNTNQKPSTQHRLRTFLRYAWGDQVAANRALLRMPPYDDYLINRRDR
jgi:hypothetical protein